jgi:predicted dehydrogenase
MLNVALIGIGNIGLLFDTNIDNKITAHSHIKALYLSKNLILKYVVDINTTNKKVIKQFFPKVKFMTNYKKLIKKTNIDILSIATPTNTHFDILNSFESSRNIKIFFIEKPLFESKLDYNKLSNNLKNKIVVNYPRRFDSAITGIKKNIQKQNIQKVIINYCKGLKNNGFHLIDMINLIFNKPKIVSSQILTNSKRFDKKDLTYDIFAEIKYKNKIIPLYFISHNYTKYNLIQFTIYTQKNKIDYENTHNSVDYYSVIEHPIFSTYKIYDNIARYSQNTNTSNLILTAYNNIENIILNKEKNISSYKDEKANVRFYYKLLEGAK